MNAKVIVMPRNLIERNKLAGQRKVLQMPKIIVRRAA